MTFLPMVQRELRAASRRPSIHRIRCWTALLAIGASLIASAAGTAITGAGSAVNPLFAVQTVCAFGLSLLAGLFLTSDCLSEEKREGTLGLLLLTDLKSHDIVLGKFVATALSALYCLLALLPVMPPLPLAPFSRGEPPGVGNLMETGFLGIFFLTISLFADILAVVWVGMWLALTMKRPVLAPALTILFVLVLPACLYRFDLVADPGAPPNCSRTFAGSCSVLFSRPSPFRLI
jgi:ABC-type transport system involved in multi-copper enzyme maturation permease subunit